MKRIVYLLLLLSICLIPKTTFAATKVEVSNESELKEAIEATTDNEITLVNDIEFVYDDTLEVEDNYLILTKGNHILNLNNHTIKIDGGSTSSYGLITLTGGSLEINGDGQISASKTVLSAVKGTLIINGGTYIAGNEDSPDAAIFTYSGNVIINKGTFKGYTYADGPVSNNNGTPSQGSSLPILSSNQPANIITNRNNASKKLGDPLDTKPTITINEGTFSTTTTIYNADLIVNGGTFGGESGIEVLGDKTSLKINDGNITGTSSGLTVNPIEGDPSVELAGGTYSCTEYNEQSPTGAITMGMYYEQKDGKGILKNLLAKNAAIDDETITEGSAQYGTTTRYYYYTNKNIKVTTPIQPKEDTNKQEKEEINNPETSDNILLSIIALISSLSMILISAKKLNNN